MWYRINSLFLPDSDYSDYLIEQYQDIQDLCQMVMPDTVVRALPGYPAAPSPTYLPPGTDPVGANGTSSASYNCSGQTIAQGAAGAGSCNGLSQEYGVTTGDLQAATGSTTCGLSSSVRMPSACQLTLIGSNTSWYVWVFR